jgi:REP element-mobilizing transposase RayT
LPLINADQRRSEEIRGKFWLFSVSLCLCGGFHFVARSCSPTPAADFHFGLSLANASATLVAHSASCGLACHFGPEARVATNTNASHLHKPPDPHHLQHEATNSADRRRHFNEAAWISLGDCKNCGCKPFAVNGTDDHVHLLVGVKPDTSLSDLVRRLKSSSSKWLHQEHAKPRFAWQLGYAGLSVSKSNASAVCRYIADQERHHQRMTFQQELIAFLKKHEIEYDERYIWE